MTTPEARLEVRSLTAGYQGVPAVRGIDLRVEPGEIVALLGSNGAGKTTLLRSIAGLIAPLSGSVRLDGGDISGRPAHRVARLGVALVPEDRALFHGLTARENLRLGRRGRSAQDDEVLALLPELRKCLDRKAGSLSGGEQQMLAVGRAMMGRPRLLMVDELSMGLAPVIVERLAPVLERIARTSSTAVLVVEQHVVVALDLADRAYVMAHGRVVVAASTSQLRDQRDLLASCYLGDLEAATQLAGTTATAPATTATTTTTTTTHHITHHHTTGR